MTGYSPVGQDIRAARGLPYATGADDPPAWHDQPFEGASDIGLMPAGVVAIKDWGRDTQPLAWLRTEPETRPAS